MQPAFGSLYNSIISIWQLLLQCEAYILLQNKTTCVGLDPHCDHLVWRYQHVGIQKVLRTSRESQPTQRKPQPQPTQSDSQSPNVRPNASWWNIVCVGFHRVGAGVGHVDFMLFVSISFALGIQSEPVFWWNMGFTCIWLQL